MYELPTRFAGSALACLMAVAALPCDAQADDASTEFVRRVAAFDGSGEELERVARELAELPDGMAAYFTLVGAQDRTRAQARLLARTAEHFNPNLVSHYVRGNLTEATGDAWRRTALELLGLHGSSDELALLADLTVEPGTNPTARPALVEPFQQALTTMLRRDGVRVRELAWLVSSAESLRGPAIRGVGASGDPEGMRWLVHSVMHAEHGSAALQELGRLARNAPADIASDVVPHLEPLLFTAELAERRHIVRILGDLGRSSSVPHLIRVLKEAETSGEQKMAHGALRRITLLDLPARAELWAEWCKEEQLWFDEQGALAVERLESESDAEVVAAIQKLSSHHLHRDRAAQALVPLLDAHASPEVRRQVCVALGRLRSNTVVAELEAALDDEDERVCQAARAALESCDSKKG